VVANDFGRDDCYLNIEGKNFERQEGVFFGDIGLDTYKGMNSSFGDLDGNLKDDAYVSNVHHELQAEGSLVWLNFTEKGSRKVELKESANSLNLLNINRFGWGAEIDWDKIYDKRMDYWYFQAQIARTGPEVHSYADKWADLRGMSIYENERDRISLNLNHKKFVDVSKVVGLNHEKNTHKNNITKAHWIGFQIEGDGIEASKDAVGTKLFLNYDKANEAKTQYKEIRIVNGFMSQSDTRAVFGLGENVSNLQLKVRWVSGKTEVFSDLEEGKYYTVQPNNLKASSPKTNEL